MTLSVQPSLSVQLIREATLGPERFGPLGPPLRLCGDTLHDPISASPAAPEHLPTCPPVDPAPPCEPAPTHLYQLTPVPLEAPTPCPRDATPTLIIEQTVLPTHVVGSLLDVLA